MEGGGKMIDIKVPPYLRTEEKPKINRAGTIKYTGDSAFIDSLRKSIEKVLISLNSRKASRKRFKRREVLK